MGDLECSLKKTNLKIEMKFKKLSRNRECEKFLKNEKKTTKQRIKALKFKRKSFGA